jgi:mRNA interferase RelE/StbE
MDVEIHRIPRKFLDDLSPKIRDNLKNHIKLLSKDPYSKQLDIKKLKGRTDKPDVFRLRVGEYRVVYAIGQGKIWITDIDHRGHIDY